MDLRDTLKRWASGPSAYVAAGVIGFLESSFVFFAIEPLLIPMMISRGGRVWLLALCPVAGNILAGLLMYGLGAMLAEPLIEPLFERFGASDDYADMIERLREDGFAALMIVGLTPFPLQIGTAAAGAAGYPLGMFVLAIALSRGVRYLALAAFVGLVGARAQAWAERYQLEIFVVGAAVFVILAILGFAI